MKHYKKAKSGQKDKVGIKTIPLITAKEIKANIGFLGIGGKMLKSLLKEKKKERML